MEDKENQLLDLIEKIEKRLAISVDQTIGENIAEELSQRTELLASTPKIMELASEIYDTAKGKVVSFMVLDKAVMESKQQIQMLYIAGKLSHESALYSRAERSVKALDRSIEGLRSLLSYDKSIKLG